jgi:outer membrane murein-binding lipoprotein Lpp
MESTVQSQSAEIIAFPLPVISPQERLARALTKLDAALAEQREAVGAWRERMGDLQSTMSQLGQSVQALNGSLNGLAERNQAARDEALRLEAWADNVLATHAESGAVVTD